MGIFDNLGKKVADAGQKTVQKTKEMSEVVRINSLISQEETKINNMYYQIGKLYVNMHGNDCEQEFSEMIASIADMEKNVQEYRSQIQDIKGIQLCKVCGAEVQRGVAFCSACGSQVPKVQIQESLGDSAKCVNCGAVVKKGNSFCTACGTPVNRSVGMEESVESVSQEEKCPKCGAAIAENATFCTECGTRL